MCVCVCGKLPYLINMQLHSNLVTFCLTLPCRVRPGFSSVSEENCIVSLLTWDHPTQLIQGSWHIIWRTSRQFGFISLWLSVLHLFLRLSPCAQLRQPSSKVNYGHSLHGGISLAVIALSIPLPCAPIFMSQIYTVVKKARLLRLWILLCKHVVNLSISTVSGPSLQKGRGQNCTCGWLVQLHVDCWTCGITERLSMFGV